MASSSRIRRKFKQRHQGTLKEFDGEPTIDGNVSTVQRSLVLPPAGNTTGNLLLIALLEHLCSLYVSDPLTRNKLFKVLCDQLRQGRIISAMPVLELDELSAIRSQYQLNFAKMIESAMIKLKVSDPTPASLEQLHCLALFMPQSMHADRPILSLRDVINFHTSRYRNEFEEVKKLGRGAYGSVYQVKNKLDGCEYAVKMIHISEQDPSLWNKIRREVELLAQLSHRHIVRYHCAWLEYQQIHIPRGKRRALPALTNHPSISSSSSGEQWSSSGSINYSADTEEALVKGACVVLCIKMELCTCSLWDMISERNTKVGNSSDAFSVVDADDTASLANQLLQAVSYIHSEDVIHRDITLKNIFLVTGDKGKQEVKLGDFGLARISSLDVPLTPDPGVRERINNDTVYDCYTSEIGTAAYAAPEQLAGCQYDCKTDLYSLGVCLYELYQPFYTAMERGHSLQAIRDQRPLPDTFTTRWPKQAETIRQLTLYDPKQRPSAGDLLQKHGYSKQQVIHDLQAQLQELRLVIKSRDSLIAEQSRVIESLTCTVEAKNLKISNLRFQLHSQHHVCM